MSWWRRAPTDDKLDRELKFHLEQHARDLIARGWDPAEARRQAQLAIGGVDQVKEECRDQRSTRWLSDVAQDARYALRLLRHTPGFAAVTLLTLALGTGATTVMFTVIDGVLLKPLPFAAPHELVAVSGQTPTWNTALFGQQRLAYLDFRDCQTESRTLDLGGWLWDTATLSAPGDADHVVEASLAARRWSSSATGSGARSSARRRRRLAEPWCSTRDATPSSASCRPASRLMSAVTRTFSRRSDRTRWRSCSGAVRIRLA
jgi:hypothetical protein